MRLFFHLLHFYFVAPTFLCFAKAGDPPPDPPKDEDEEFWEKEGVKDPEERDAIRARARVIRYANYRTAKEAEEAKTKKGDGKDKKPWYKKD